MKKKILTRADLDYFSQHPVSQRLLLPFIEALNDSMKGKTVVAHQLQQTGAS
jgi:hypothetical protein